MSMEKCPCCSGKTFNECCLIFLSGKAYPKTAEALMRSRYTAYAKEEIQYLHDTMYIDTRKEFDYNKTLEWSKKSKWKKLEIVSTKDGKECDIEGSVEFIAVYEINNKDYVHNELAVFKKVDDIWYFVDGDKPKVEQYVRETPKVGRNDDCPCGSGKKYKKCCLK